MVHELHLNEAVKKKRVHESIGILKKGVLDGGRVQKRNVS